MVSTIWGICFSLKANPSECNAKSFDTVLPRSRSGSNSVHFRNNICLSPRGRELFVSQPDPLGAEREPSGFALDRRDFPADPLVFSVYRVLYLTPGCAPPRREESWRAIRRAMVISRKLRV